VRHARHRRKSSAELYVSELTESPSYCIKQVQRDCFGPEIQVLQRVNHSHVIHCQHASISFWVTGSYASAAGSNLLICQEANTPLSAPLVAPFRSSHDHADAHTSASPGSSNWDVGLREVFWILRARQAVKVLYTYLPCKIAKNHFGQEREGPMWADKVIASKHFQVTGIDFAGPSTLKGNSFWNNAMSRFSPAQQYAQYT
jgi:hypothetical protein